MPGDTERFQWITKEIPRDSVKFHEVRKGSKEAPRASKMLKGCTERFQEVPEFVFLI